ncbi:MAG: phospho-N-acetylmuramoyl-pentapeptide-transferase [Armatimonadetes bacterium]|nr:phospho-N-acetylmuramoyl-pentapeptide-transferase [Armatimonadota bacterium]
MPVDSRLLGAFLLPLAIAIMAYPPFIRKMQVLKWGQEIRPEGPEDHLAKKGTPTMGGLVLLLSVLTALVWAYPPGTPLLVLLAYVLANGAIGFLDDWTKIAAKRSLGLKARQKLILQVSLAVGLAWFAFNETGYQLWLPLIGWIHAPVLKWILAILVALGTANAVNLTDGLDGLAGGTVMLACLAYIPICIWSSQEQLAIVAAALTGACAGFLWFNCFPARVFMGDTGSLALGGALAAFALYTRTELLLAVVGGVFVVEALSVMIQVSYFKATKGKRVFLMSPIHHHYCKMGLHEVQVTTRFWIIAAILAFVSVWGYYFGMFGGRAIPPM